MGNTSKDLLGFEHKNSSTSAIESAFLVCNKKDSLSETHKPDPDKKLVTAPIPKSQADLNTPEAVAAVESAIAGNQLVIPLAASSSETESDDNSGDSNFDEDSEDNGNDDDKAYSPMNLETQTDDTSSKSAKKDWSKKHSRIIELS